LNSKLEHHHPFAGVYAGKRVLVTGHTGFKGSWLCEWLLALGADVTGFALPPPTEPALFDQLGLGARLHDLRGDVRDLPAVRNAIKTARPDFVFHLAAQPLVRLSYAQPVETYATNVMGTVNVLEALRLYQDELKLEGSSSRSDFSGTGTDPLNCRRVIAAVVVTTDKCYENHGREHNYREDEPMGGHDPYSSSKGAVELVVSAYRRSYFSREQGAGSQTPVIRLASARAGNVIGGGDWALDRIVPDCIRSLQRSEIIPVRHPRATRPWQHVLEPLSGYLWLAARMSGSSLHAPFASVSRSENRGQTPAGQQAGTASSELCCAFNFGPTPASSRPVADLVAEVLRHWPGRSEDRSEPGAVHEAALLSLSIEKARSVLDWQPVWDFAATVAHTVAWYRPVSADATQAPALTRRHIADYQSAARQQQLAWTHE
jgi:CDP-glucose 4,6-dehydratase